MKKLLSYLFALAAVAFAFTSCEDVPIPYDYPNSGNNSENVDPNAKGQSADNPYTVQEAVQLIKDGKAPTTEVYVKGVVSKVDYYSEDYHSLSYYLSDDGKTEDLQVYSGKGLNGADFNSKSDLKVGQTVIVKGVIKSFDKKGTTIYEVDKNSQIVSIEGEGTQEQPGDEKGQSKENPYTVKEAVNLIKEGKAPTTEVYVKGVVSKVDYYSKDYHSLSYYLSDDGKTEDLQVYSGKGLNGADFNSKSDLKVGQTVIVKGVIKSFDKKGTTIYEVDKNSQIVSIEGNGETPSTGDKGLSKDNPLTPSEALDIAKALGKGNTSTESYYIKGKISSIKFSFDAEHGTATFNISADGSKSDEFACYSVYYFGNKAWAKGYSQVKVGDEVIVYGKLTNFNGTPETASRKACLYSLNGKTE